MESQSQKGGWDVLREDYMMDPNLKDWDAQNGNDAGIASGSEED